MSDLLNAKGEPIDKNINKEARSRYNHDPPSLTIVAKHPPDQTCGFKNLTDDGAIVIDVLMEVTE